MPKYSRLYISIPKAKPPYCVSNSRVFILHTSRGKGPTEHAQVLRAFTHILRARSHSVYSSAKRFIHTSQEQDFHGACHMLEALYAHLESKDPYLRSRAQGFDIHLEGKAPMVHAKVFRALIYIIWARPVWCMLECLGLCKHISRARLA